MTSTTAWTAGAPAPRRRHVAVRGVIFAIVLAAVAVVVLGGIVTFVTASSGTGSATPPPAAGPAEGGAPSPGDVVVPVEAPRQDEDGAAPEQQEDAADDVDASRPDEPNAPDPEEVTDGADTADEAETPDDSETPDEAGGGDGEDDAGDAEEEEADPVEEPEPGMTTAEVQERLRELRFLVGPADGRAGQQTTAAVMAFQRVNGLSVDGVVGPATTAALEAGTAEPTLAGGPDDRIEVDLDAQVLHVIEAGQRVTTMQVSSGNGATYTNANGAARARTPVGQFVIERRIHGVREAALGTLYDPLYFHRGFAIHGSPSVPAYPASHGCVRVTRADAAWLIDRMPDGLPVHLYGGTHVFTPAR